MSISWTAEQEQVIHERGRNLLVSAAAGSGKTAVLVERILSLITDEEHPVDIDRLLVVTFTRAAAAEMKERISRAIAGRLAENPEDEHLQRQNVLLPGARISTIDSFCTYVIQNYFHTIDLDPGYRMADEGELRLIRADVLEELLEERYAEEDPAFVRFVESFSRGKNDDVLETQIERIYQFAASSPDPEGWLSGCLEAYRADSPKKLQEAGWMRALMERTRLLIRDAVPKMEEAIRIANGPGGPAASLSVLEGELDWIRAIMRGSTYDEMRQAFLERPTAQLRMSGKKYTDVDPDKIERVKSLRNEARDSVKNIGEKAFRLTSDEILGQLHSILPLAEETVAIVREFSRRFAQKKREEGIMDFSDLEHFALQILYTRTDDGWEKTDAAKELSGRFDAVMCDEYQDSNLMQELLLEAVSGTDEKRYDRFMVGDMKQSIYAFRMARPDLFMEKYRTYVPLLPDGSLKTEDDGAVSGVRITLGQNFRSRREVIDPVNVLFRRIMRGEPGGVLYDEDAELRAGASYPELPDGCSDRAELILLDKNDEKFGSDSSRETMTETEAMIAVAKIRAIVGKQMVYDRDADTMRRASYRDIVILLRNAEKNAPVYERVLTGSGIPAFTTSSRGYFSAVEVVTVLNYLRILDNPRQDIPMVAVLKSPIGGLTDRELAEIRSADPERPYYEAVRTTAEKLRDKSSPDGELPDGDRTLSEKLERFLGTYEKLRVRVPYITVHELITEVLDETGYGSFAAAMPAGAKREANLNMLVEKAVSYEKTSYHGLFNFIRYIEKMNKYEVDFGEVSPEGEAGDVVRIMTIHKSKGLEFPIVILGGLGFGFNDKDTKAGTALHPDAGIGLDVIDPEKRTRTVSMIHTAINGIVRDDMLGEEMRVLYVAMTRAKERLIMTGSCAREKKCADIFPEDGPRKEGRALTYAERTSASCYLDWILPALPDESLVHAAFADPAEIGETEQNNAEETKAFLRKMKDAAGKGAKGEEIYADPSVRAFLEKRRGFVYPYERTAELPAKFSVSELKMRAIEEMQEEAGEEAFPEEPVIPYIPEFMRDTADRTADGDGRKEDAGGAGRSGAARGTAYHQVFRALDLFDAADEEAVCAQIRSMVKRGILSEADAAAVNPADIAAFASSRLCARMREAQTRGELRREQPFVIDIPANEIDPSYHSDEPILIQGVIDAYFKEDDKYVIVDYKTDRVAGGGGSFLVRRYRTQFLYYRRAIEQLLRAPVGEMILYSTVLREELPVR